MNAEQDEFSEIRKKKGGQTIPTTFRTRHRPGLEKAARENGVAVTDVVNVAVKRFLRRRGFTIN